MLVGSVKYLFEKLKRIFDPYKVGDIIEYQRWGPYSHERVHTGIILVINPDFIPRHMDNKFDAYTVFNIEEAIYEGWALKNFRLIARK